MSALDRVTEYVPRKPDDDLPLTGFLLSSGIIAFLYLLLWSLDAGHVQAYGNAMDTVGLLLLSIGFFGFTILRALAQLQPRDAIPGPGVHPANSPSLVYSASFCLTGATLALAALGFDVFGLTVPARLLDLFVTLFAWAVVYVHIAGLGEGTPRPLFRLLTIPRWRSATTPA